MEEMNFGEFAAWCVAEIKVWVEQQHPGARMEVHPIDTLGKTYLGLSLFRTSRAAAPTVNLHQYYERYTLGTPKEILLVRMKLQLEQAVVTDGVKWLQDPNAVREKLFVRVSQRKKKRALLESVPHRKIADLAITYHILISQSAEHLGSIILRHDMAEELGFKEEEIHAMAMASGQVLFPPVFTPLEEIVQAAKEKDPAGNWRIPQHPSLHLVTNQSIMNGAAALFYPGFMQQAAQTLQGSYYVIPSSIHEILLLPSKGVEDVRSMESTIRRVNKTLVQPEAVLSDHLYHYDAQTQQFERADSYLSRRFPN